MRTSFSSLITLVNSSIWLDSCFVLTPKRKGPLFCSTEAEVGVGGWGYSPVTLTNTDCCFPNAGIVFPGTFGPLCGGVSPGRLLPRVWTESLCWKWQSCNEATFSNESPTTSLSSSKLSCENKTGRSGQLSHFGKPGTETDPSLYVNTVSEGGSPGLWPAWSSAPPYRSLLANPGRRRGDPGPSPPACSPDAAPPRPAPAAASPSGGTTVGAVGRPPAPGCWRLPSSSSCHFVGSATRLWGDRTGRKGQRWETG